MKKKSILFLKYLFVCLVFFICNDAISQLKMDLEEVNEIFNSENKKNEYKEFAKGNSNEIQFLASGLFLFYKNFISSQDGNHCVFHPSCSVYAIQSIKKNGFLLGLSDGIDRLMRCNRLSPENYERFENTNLYFDPVWISSEKK